MAHQKDLVKPSHLRLELVVEGKNVKDICDGLADVISCVVGDNNMSGDEEAYFFDYDLRICRSTKRCRMKEDN